MAIPSPNPNPPLVARLAVQATNNHPFRRFSSDGDISFPVGGFQKKFRLINKITTEQ
jgi:hypothetical protein